ncbi:MAG TPA: metallophosphoesterase [Terriglobales bacterium]|jgi:3',5'-cyclic AMP phosphodiesterase CpdA|nr:metallophosphoesterase [Terriglobales bacterium]
MNRRTLIIAVGALLACSAIALRPRTNASAKLALQEAASTAPSQLDLKLPLDQKSVRFVVIGDNGTGESAQYEVAGRMEAYRKVVGYDFVTMMGDNIYGGHKPKDFEQKFEIPYKPLLDAGVKFYACLGNHDDSNETLYKPFNMNGQRYYSFKKGDVQFFVLDSNYMDSAQLDWIDRQLSSSSAKWKIAYFHHPLYSDGRFHGPDLDLRKQLMPLFGKYGLNVVLSGHDHVYERFKPEEGIYFFLVGNSGQLRYRNLRQGSGIMAAGFDTDCSFMIVEISGDKLYFQTVSRTGQTVDSGVMQRQSKPQTASQAAGQIR